MHVGGACAKWLTRGDVAFGHGVAPVRDWPPLTGGAFAGASAVVDGLAGAVVGVVAAVAAVVVVAVADPERIRAVADHIARTRRRGDDVVAVISAMGKETDELLRLAALVSDTRPGREMDMLITAGERKAMALVSMALSDL